MEALESKKNHIVFFVGKMSRYYIYIYTEYENLEALGQLFCSKEDIYDIDNKP